MGGLMSSVETSINANITDIINHSNSVVINDIYELNKDFYEGYQWIAALDRATCLACAALDNKIFDKLPGMPGEGTEPPDEPPLHHNCRCIIVPVLEGMRDDPSQTKVNYQDWFDRQDRATKIDIVGPARYKEYLNGKAITSFSKDGRIKTLKELKIDRITRQQLFNELVEKAGIPKQYDIDGIKKLYNDNMTEKEMIDVFMKRYSYFELDILDKMPKKQIQILLREYDLLLQQYPVGGRLVEIKIEHLVNAAGRYILKNSAIYFQKKFVNGDTIKRMKQLHGIGFSSTNNKNHVYIHEFAHAIDRAINKNGKIGRQLLLEEIKKRGFVWRKIAGKISEYAMTIPKGTTVSMEGGEFFTEAFTAWRNGTINQNDPELNWIIDFFNDLSL
jgi:hypothetical protein